MPSDQVNWAVCDDNLRQPYLATQSLSFLYLVPCMYEYMKLPSTGENTSWPLLSPLPLHTDAGQTAAFPCAVIHKVDETPTCDELTNKRASYEASS